MTTLEILNVLRGKPEIGLQLSKRSGMLNSTWIIYFNKGFYYYFDISEKIIFDNNHKYSKDSFLKEFENAYFEIDCECI